MSTDLLLHPTQTSMVETVPSVPLGRVLAVLAVWLLCALAVVVTGALNGSVIGALATIVLVFDAAVFTKGFLR